MFFSLSVIGNTPNCRHVHGVFGWNRWGNKYDSKKNDASRATHGHAHSGLAQKILRVSLIMVQAYSPWHSERPAPRDLMRLSATCSRCPHRDMLRSKIYPSPSIREPKWNIRALQIQAKVQRFKLAYTFYINKTSDAFLEINTKLQI